MSPYPTKLSNQVIWLHADYDTLIMTHRKVQMGKQKSHRQVAGGFYLYRTNRADAPYFWRLPCFTTAAVSLYVFLASNRHIDEMGICDAKTFR
jgi:hypothetical protein